MNIIILVGRKILLIRAWEFFGEDNKKKYSGGMSNAGIGNRVNWLRQETMYIVVSYIRI